MSHDMAIKMEDANPQVEVHIQFIILKTFGTPA